MNLLLRPLAAQEFEISTEIREIKSSEALMNWQLSVERSGTWDDHYLHLAIDLDGSVVGVLQIRHCPKTMPAGVLELGIDIAHNQRGRGIATQALALAAEKFLQDSYHRLSGSTSAENRAMIRAFEKADWCHEGTLKSLFKEDGKLVDYESFSKTLPLN